MSANQSKRPKRAAKPAAQGARAAAKPATRAEGPEPAAPIVVAGTPQWEALNREEMQIHVDLERTRELLTGADRLLSDVYDDEPDETTLPEVIRPCRIIVETVLEQLQALDRAIPTFTTHIRQSGQAVSTAGGRRLADAIVAVQDLNPPTLAGALELIERYTTTRGPEHKSEMVATARRIQQASVNGKAVKS